MSDSSIFEPTFWKAALERCAKSAAYSASATLIASGAGLLTAAWTDVLSVAGMAAVLSVLGSVASDKLTSGAGPSLTNAEVLDPPA